MLTLSPRTVPTLRFRLNTRKHSCLPATLSLDLDNRWSYLKTHGEHGWETAPTYLPVVVPRVLEILDEMRLRITWFVVGRDADHDQDQESLRALTAAGHEIGNHSYHHEPWLHLYSELQLEEELGRAEEAIIQATGCRPIGFRGPGFSYSPEVIRVLARRGYLYDASTFPTFLGPVARLYYMMTTRLPPEERQKRSALFGRFREGFRRNRPYVWQTMWGNLLEIPVTTMPLIRTPIHVSYLLYLSCFSERIADAYCLLGLRLCRATNTPPSWLLHPLDFLGQEDAPDLGFFPAMNLPRSIKILRVKRWLRMLCDHFAVIPLGDFARLHIPAQSPKAVSQADASAGGPQC